MARIFISHRIKLRETDYKPRRSACASAKNFLALTISSYSRDDMAKRSFLVSCVFCSGDKELTAGGKDDDSPEGAEVE